MPVVTPMVKSKKTLEEFLLEYNRLETLLKKSTDKPVMVLDYENSLTDIDVKEKLKVCRILRNYCRHHEDYSAFVDVTDGMLEFIRGVNFELEKPYLHVSDKTKRVTPISGKDSLKTAVELLAKHKTGLLPLVNPDGKTGKDSIDGVVTRDMLLGMISESGSLSAKIGKAMTEKIMGLHPEYFVADPGELLEEYTEGDIIVVAKNGRYKGIVVW